MSTPLVVHPDVETALSRHQPVVALESAVITHGLPRSPLSLSGVGGWSTTEPANLSLARLLHQAIAQQGATPAQAALLHGRLHVGLSDAQLVELASDRSAAKCSARDLAHLAHAGRTAGTTVAGTLAACGLLEPSIRVFATGGIGGIHRDWTRHLDISADLLALACSPVCVVCSGAKAILDLDATVEALDALNVPVIGYRCDCLPRFVVGGRSHFPVCARVNTADDVAMVCRRHWHDFRRPSAVLVVQDCPADVAIDEVDAEQAIGEALAEASDRNVHGAALTPFLLERLRLATGVRSLRANVALLEANARLAASIAVAWVAAAKTGP